MPEQATPVSSSAKLTSAPPPTIIVERRSSPTLVVTVLVMAILGSGAVVWFVAGQSRPKEGLAGNSEATTSTVLLDGFTVNLADPEETHFLRVTMNLAVERLPVPREREKPMSGVPTARVRDTTLNVLTVCKAEALLTPSG